MGKWVVSGTHKRVIIDSRLDKHYVAYNEFQASRIKDAFNAYEARIPELEAERDKARRALERAGFIDNGAQEWKPPIGWGDTGTLTRRLLDTQDELARVKAESLRVVEDPDSDEWVMTPDGLGWYGEDAIGNPSIETPHGYHQFADCKKVRLERWEMEE